MRGDVTGKAIKYFVHADAGQGHWLGEKLFEICGRGFRSQRQVLQLARVLGNYCRNSIPEVLVLLA